MPQTRTFLPLPADIADSAELRPLVERANGWLNEQIPEWPTPLTVEWYRVHTGEAVPSVGVKLTEKNGHVHGVFPVSVLTDPSAFQARVSRILFALTDVALAAINRRLDEMPALEGAF